MIAIESWPRWVGVAAGAPLAYGAVVLVLRAAGKRTLSKLNAFDFIVTIALGSLLATVMVSPSVTLTAGLVAIVALIGLQAVVTWVSVRWSFARRILTSPPSAVVVNGCVVDDALERNRLTPGELRQALRQHGVSTIHDVDLVVLETDGTLSVLQGERALHGWATQDVER